MTPNPSAQAERQRQATRSRAEGTVYIFSARALASYRRRPLSSNVRPHMQNHIHRRAFLFSLLLALQVHGALAGPTSYQCTIKEQLSLEKDGTLRRPPSPWLIGSRFAVDRASGRLTGPEKSLWSYSDSDYSVLAPGNSDNSFVAMATTRSKGIGLHVTLVTVEEFIAGPSKPFSASSGGESYSGQCD